MATPNGGAARLSYVPKPHEANYYDGLFAVADSQRAGSIGGAEAVRFFQTSGLPVDGLKMVWTVADQPPTNQLDKRKFAIAVRLIQLLQNGQKGEGANLAAPEGVVLKPVHFEGITGVKVPLPPPETAAQAAAPPMQQYAQQPPPQQQQQAPPPPMQYQQQAPPAPMQYQQPQAPMASARPPMQPPGSMSYALTVQDPYIMTPAERSRYEQLFPQYAKDGFVYGAEAVALFMKSGMQQQHLATIWNLVDTNPVDNRLDPLEFAMAMHLIVCVSKKNLPLPPTLPNSLKQLKEQQHGAPQHQQPPPTVVVQQQQPSLPSQPGSPLSTARSSAHVPNIPSPRASFQYQQQPPSIPSPKSSFQYQQQPPSVPSPQASFQYQQQPPSIPSPQASFQYQQQQQARAPSSPMAQYQQPPPAPPLGGSSISDAFEGLGGEASNPASYLAHAPPPSFGGGASVASSALSFDHAPDHHHVAIPSPVPESYEPPAPAPAVMTEQRNMPAHQYHHPKEANNMSSSSSEDLVKLKGILQKLQAENISLKATMGGLSEDEKEVQHELHAVVAELTQLSNELTSLRAKVLASKSKLLVATAELKASHEKKSVITDLITEARATKDALEDAYQGIEKLNEEARAAPAPAPAYENDLFGFDTGMSSAPIPQQQQKYSQPPKPQFSAAPADTPKQAYSQDTSVDITNTYPSYGSEKQQKSHGSEQQQSIHRANAYESYDSGAGGYGLGTVSSGYMEGEGIMGGAPTPLPSENYGGGTDYSGGVPSAAEIADFKNKLKEAQDVAKDSEESMRQTVAHADELRRLADEADEAARRYQNQPESKKKGFLGKKKKITKDPAETERLALEAKRKKDELMKVQSQVNDANKLARETKAEEERLRKQIEDMELKAASMASLQQKQPSPSPPPQQNGGYSMQQNHSNDSNDYGGFGVAMGTGGGTFKASPPPPTMGVFGGPSGGSMIPPSPQQAGAFNSNVMAGGGASIPEPSGYDPYDNPFGE